VNGGERERECVGLFEVSEFSMMMCLEREDCAKVIDELGICFKVVDVIIFMLLLCLFVGCFLVILMKDVRGR
jgi:hypothetical protein